jgi:tRNA A37 methylthiotransferase MiaB
MRIQQGISLSLNEALVGTVQDVIVDGLEDENAGADEGENEGAGGGADEGENEGAGADAGADADTDENADANVYIGRTRGDAPEIDNAVIFTAKGIGKDRPRELTGKIVKVLVTDAMDYDLVGVVQ